ncbi:terminase [Plantactinospora sp. WMMB782]|uniref:terminase n=1 Tax=Plantactinospora sp. WMMB782 TaxID=3404121 RepID=UPI003B9443E0
MAKAVVELTAEEIDLLHPIYLGPTWLGEDGEPTTAGPWRLPEHTLGWEIVKWVADYLLGEDGKPFRLTLEQLRFLLWWYAVDESGRFIYRTGVLQRLKGWGKDPLGAVICLVEFVGPSRFSHWKNGSPVGKAHPQAWVQIAAVSREQTKNTMTLMPSLMSDKLIQTYGIKVGAELMRADRGRKRLEAITSNPRTLEGGRSTMVLLNETHHWLKGNNGHAMYETIDGNTTKKDSRYLAITNAYLPGEDSVAERMRLAYDDIVAGLAPDVGFCYDSIEAHPKTPLTATALEIVLPKIRGDAVWLRIPTIIQSIYNKSIAPSRSRRMWLNQIVADEDALFGPDHLADIERPKAELKPGDRIVMGFDGGKTDDSTALVAIRLSDNTAFLLAVWERPAQWPADEPWEVPHARVDSAVHDAFKVYDVAAFYADVAFWESYISSWNEAYGASLAVKARPGNPIGWDMRASLQRNTRANELLMDAIFKKQVFFDGDETLRRHTLNTRRRTNNYGDSFGKEDARSRRKVDAYAAWMLAYAALTDLRNNAKPEKQHSTAAWFL